MKSKLADELRREDIAAMLAMTPEERIALAFELGDEALEMFATARGITRDEALRELRRNGRKGRTYSRCIEELDEGTPRADVVLLTLRDEVDRLVGELPEDAQALWRRF